MVYIRGNHHNSVARNCWNNVLFFSPQDSLINNVWIKIKAYKSSKLPFHLLLKDLFIFTFYTNFLCKFLISSFLFANEKKKKRKFFHFPIKREKNFISLENFFINFFNDCSKNFFNLFGKLLTNLSSFSSIKKKKLHLLFFANSLITIRLFFN